MLEGYRNTLQMMLSFVEIINNRVSSWQLLISAFLNTSNKNSISYKSAILTQLMLQAIEARKQQQRRAVVIEKIVQLRDTQAPVSLETFVLNGFFQSPRKSSSANKPCTC